MNSFRSYIQGLESTFAQQGYVVNFEGHDGQIFNQITPFDFIRFNARQETSLDLKILGITVCQQELLKQNSLFITDLAVVEDLSRTFNTMIEAQNPGQQLSGNPNGIYTFGTLMKNMANTPVTSVSAKDFIKSWIKTWFVNTSTNGRFGVLRTLVRPWISRANGSTQIDFTIDELNWEQRWDAISDESELLKWAPFKLTAIANRLDLRGNSSYNPNLNTSGETRFIFSLVSLYTDYTQGLVLGKVPFETDQSTTCCTTIDPGAIDWGGMNVIFEYVNVQTNLCDLVSFAQQWADLSTYTGNAAFGSQYRDDLEDITSTVILNSNIQNKPNGSTIGRVRTNEKVLHNAGSGGANWAKFDWQFRQFEINPSTHLLEQVYLENTPPIQSITNNVISNSYTFYNLADPNINVNLYQQGEEALTDWAYTPSNKIRILQERHQIPKFYTWVNSNNVSQNVELLAKEGNVSKKYLHYLDLTYFKSCNANGNNSLMVNFNPSTQTNFAPNSTVGDRPIEKRLRHKLSLNTCQGCHNGETKTIFTHMAPLGYGESAKYWDENNPPDSKNGVLDTRNGNSPLTQVVMPNLNGKLTDHNATNYENYSQPLNSYEDYQNVSAFITGRRYLYGSYQDDVTDPADLSKDENPAFPQLSDDKLTGRFIVNDPSNDEGGSDRIFRTNTQKWSFNELERRKADLCNLIKVNCNANQFPVTISAIKSLSLSTLFE